MDIEVKRSFPEAPEGARGGFSSGGAVQSKIETPLPSSAGVVKGPGDEAKAEVEAYGRETLSQLMEKAADLLSLFDRELKYEILEEAGVVQVQVIDARDGRVVRKVPSDEVVKFIEALRNKIDDRVDVWA
jgi:uncharacterized FlaG/YvyC family protein